MKRLSLMLLALATGCGPTNGPPAQKAPAKSSVAAAPSKVIKPAQPTVAADAFASVDDAVQSLCEAAQQSDSDLVRQAEAWLLMQKDAAIAPLSQVLNDDQAGPAARIVACRTLRRLGPGAKPGLKQALDTESEQIRLNAIKGLGLIRPTDAEIIEILTALVDDQPTRVRVEAVFALANVGPAANDAVGSRLVEILNDTEENETLRGAAKRALEKINPRRTFQD